MELYKILLYVSLVSVILPTILYVRTFRQLPRQTHLVGVFVIVSLATDVVAFALMKSGKATILVNNIFDLCSFVLVSLFYVRLLANSKLTSLFVVGSGIYGISLIYYTSSFGVFASHTPIWAINGAIVAMYGLLYFILLPSMIVQRLLDKNLYSYVVINGSLLFYFTVTILLFVSANYFLNNADSETNMIVWSFHNIANILKNLGLAVGLYYTGRRNVKTTLLEIERISRERTGQTEDEFDSSRFSR